MYSGEMMLTNPGVVPGSQLFDTPGSYTFTIPQYNLLTVHVWGAGGAGGSGYASANYSANGGNSVAFGITAQGGGGGQGGLGYRTVATGGGIGGTSTNGNIVNISGGNGDDYYASPSYTIKSGGAGANGGAGGNGASAIVYGGSNGYPGTVPGGGGGASYYDSGGGAWAHTVSGGGGSYGQSQFTYYIYPKGSTTTITVGAGGAADLGDVSTSRGGAGANGKVYIVWT